MPEANMIHDKRFQHITARHVIMGPFLWLHGSAMLSAMQKLYCMDLASADM